MKWDHNETWNGEIGNVMMSIAPESTAKAQRLAGMAG